LPKSSQANQIFFPMDFWEELQCAKTSRRKAIPKGLEGKNLARHMQTQSKLFVVKVGQE